MANTTHYHLLLFFTLLIVSAAHPIQGSRVLALELPHQQMGSPNSPFQRETHVQGDSEGHEMRNSRRLMIGSTAPTCTYNECRGCKHKCRAEQVPVEGNDPINSAYHYRCVCHR